MTFSKVVETLEAHQIRHISIENGSREWVECTCSTDPDNFWRGITAADHMKHQSAMMIPELREMLAVEIESIVNDTTYGWAIGTTLKRRAKLIRQGIDPKFQCVHCGGGGKSYSDEIKSMDSCPDCNGVGHHYKEDLVKEERE